MRPRSETFYCAITAWTLSTRASLLSCSLGASYGSVDLSTGGGDTFIALGFAPTHLIEVLFKKSGNLLCGIFPLRCVVSFGLRNCSHEHLAPWH